jgi:hypothetical protein
VKLFLARRNEENRKADINIFLCSFTTDAPEERT